MVYSAQFCFLDPEVLCSIRPGQTIDLAWNYQGLFKLHSAKINHKLLPRASSFKGSVVTFDFFIAFQNASKQNAYNHIVDYRLRIFIR